MSAIVEMRTISVWDRHIRFFHWINVLSVLALAAIGTAILFADALAIPREGELLLKTIHAYVGYVFVLNLLWRITWAFVGSPHARWAAFLPFRRGWWAETRDYASAFARGRQRQYAGHSPLGRLAVTCLLLLCTTQAVTGLVLAGTDLFYPPFGATFARWVAAPGVDARDVVPNRPELIDQAARTEMRAFRSPFKQVHEYSFYLLVGLVALHVAAVVIVEHRGGGTLTSGMVTGRKILTAEPVDARELGSVTDGQSVEQIR
jgi:Ni/Fe-hydrogenase 1 B-type cytochrome subunit